MAQKKEFCLTAKIGTGGHIATDSTIALIRLVSSDKLRTVKKVLTCDQLLMFKDLLYMRAQTMTSCRVLYPNDEVLQQSCLASYQWQEL